MTAAPTGHATVIADSTGCPPRRSFVASDARRRGQPCIQQCPHSSPSGMPPAMFAGVDNATDFSLIPDT